VRPCLAIKHTSHQEIPSSNKGSVHEAKNSGLGKLVAGQAQPIAGSLVRARAAPLQAAVGVPTAKLCPDRLCYATQ
jgi:hypothetical protein